MQVGASLPMCTWVMLEGTVLNCLSLDRALWTECCSQVRVQVRVMVPLGIVRVQPEQLVSEGSEDSFWYKGLCSSTKYYWEHTYLWAQ
jgi:hypothetical protein